MSTYENYIFAFALLDELEEMFTEELKICIMIDDELNSKDNVEYGRLLATTDNLKYLLWFRSTIEAEFSDLEDDEE